jgi:predicted phosphoadenosine phosphosulfate sulfurtransferase
MVVLKKKEIETNVYESALNRFRYLFDSFDKVVISFSGGKDSTACLNLGLKIAREKNKLPLDVYFWDEEVLMPETEEYLMRVKNHPDIRFKWLCVPVKHRNGGSRRNPFWYPFDPNCKDKWVRPIPDFAVTHVNGFQFGHTIPEISHRVYDHTEGRVADVRGLRAQESLTRFRAVAHRTKDNWITSARSGYSYGCSPIYDWTSSDVWLAPKIYNWDYNKVYDVLDKMGVSKHEQRVCVPFGEEPMRGLWQYKVGWPELWAKMCDRVPGAATAEKYSRTQLYGFGGITLPKGKTWKDWFYDNIALYDPEQQKFILNNVKNAVKNHLNIAKRAVPESKPDNITGLSWKGLCMIALRGDMKGRRLRTMSSLGDSHSKKLIDEMRLKDETRY